MLHTIMRLLGGLGAVALILPALAAVPRSMATYQGQLLGEAWPAFCEAVRRQPPREPTVYRFADGEVACNVDVPPGEAGETRTFRVRMRPQSFAVARRLAADLLGAEAPAVVAVPPVREVRGYTYCKQSPGGVTTLFLHKAPGMVDRIEITLRAE